MVDTANHTQMKRILHIGFIAGIGCLIFIFFLRPFSGEGDFFHHLNTGRYILTRHSFPLADPWTFTAFGKPWVSYGWGTGVIFELIYKPFGSAGITVFIALIAVLNSALLYLLVRSAGSSKKAALFAVLFTLPVLATRWPARPELFTYLGTILILLINTWRKNQPALAWLFPVVILVWANMYGASVFVGMGLLVLVAIEDRKLLLPALAGLAAAFISPNTYRAVFYNVLYIPKIARFQGEWASVITTLRQSPIEYLLSYQYRVGMYLLYAAVVVLCYGLTFKKHRISPWVVLPVFLIIPLWAFRLAPLFVILSAPFVGLSVTKSKYLYFPIVVVLLVNAYLSVWITPITSTAQADTDGQKLVTFIKTNHLTGNVMNDQEIGAWLTYNLYPGIRVMYDTRDDLFLNTPVLTNMLLGRDTHALASQMKADMVIIDYASAGPTYESLITSADWSVVFLSGRLMMLVPSRTALAKRLPVVAGVDPFSPDGAISGKESDAISAYRLAGTPSFVAELLLATHQYAEVLAMKQKFDDGSGPSSPVYVMQKDAYLARAYIGLGHCSDAEPLIQNIRTLSQGKLIFSPYQTLTVPDMPEITASCTSLAPLLQQ